MRSKLHDRVGPLRPESDKGETLLPSRLSADCVAKVASCRATNFSRKPEQEAIADSYSLTRITEVA